MAQMPNPPLLVSVYIGVYCKNSRPNSSYRKDSWEFFTAQIPVLFPPSPQGKLNTKNPS